MHTEHAPEFGDNGAAMLRKVAAATILGIPSSSKVKHEYPCTECGGDAFIGYSGWSGPAGGVIAETERLCSACAQKRNVSFSLRPDRLTSRPAPPPPC